MSPVVSLVVGLLFAFLVYLAICQNGPLLGYVLNFVYCIITYYFQSPNPEITIIVIAAIFLGAALLTLLEYIACQKTQSFFGYLAYIVVTVIVIVVIVYLTKVLFTFLADPSILFRT